jgi:hypothetical protein
MERIGLLMSVVVEAPWERGHEIPLCNLMSGNVKGKNRARSMSETERTPLLRGSTPLHNSTPSFDENGDLPHVPVSDRQLHQRSILSQVLSWIAVLTLIAFFLFLIFFAFIWVTLQGAPAVRQLPESIVSHAIRWRTTSVGVQNVSDGRISILVRGEFGVDTDWVLGIDTEDNSAMAFARRAAGRWLTSTLGGFRSDSPTAIIIRDSEGTLLLNCLAFKLSLPIRGTTRAGKVSMAPVEIPIQLSPISDTEDLVRFAESSWTRGIAQVNAAVPRVTLQALRRTWWLPSVQRIAPNVSQDIFITCRLFSLCEAFACAELFLVPQTPEGYPQPGSPLNVSEILHVGSYHVDIERRQNPTKVVFSAWAELVLPFTSSSDTRILLPSLSPTLSFLVSLLESPESANGVAFAMLSTDPALNTTSALASLSFPITGSLLPIQPPVVGPLSRLISNYLSAKPSAILIETARDHQSSSIPLALPPTRMTFPGPSKRPKILRKVTVKNMRLGSSPTGDELTASGTLIASFGLPRELSGLTPLLDIRRLWPDTLVFDGLPPPANVSEMKGEDTATRPVPPLPDPLPEGAFARILPLDWLEANMLPDNGDEEDGVRVRWVTAQIVDVPLEILPGKEAEFQKFVRKVSVRIILIPHCVELRFRSARLLFLTLPIFCQDPCV